MAPRPGRPPVGPHDGRIRQLRVASSWPSQFRVVGLHSRRRTTGANRPRPPASSTRYVSLAPAILRTYVAIRVPDPALGHVPINVNANRTASSAANLPRKPTTGTCSTVAAPAGEFVLATRRTDSADLRRHGATQVMGCCTSSRRSTAAATSVDPGQSHRRGTAVARRSRRLLAIAGTHT